MKHYHWWIRQEQGMRGELSWTFGPFEFICAERRLIWRWVKNGEWECRTLLKF